MIAIKFWMGVRIGRLISAKVIFYSFLLVYSIYVPDMRASIDSW